MVERDIYFDANGRPYFSTSFDIKKAERVMGNLEVDDVVKVLEDISRLADFYELRHQSFVDHDGNVVFVD